MKEEEREIIKRIVEIEEEYINRTLDKIEEEWNKISDDEDDTCEGVLTFDTQLEVIKKALKSTFLAGQNFQKCSVCKDGLTNTQLICWTCFCEMKDKVREEGAKVWRNKYLNFIRKSKK